LKGESFNGNVFASKALEAGASYAVIDEPQSPSDDRFIMVSDVLKALQDLSVFHRNSLDIPFIAITGSNGKTSTKELLRDVLSKKYKVHATKGNFNNHIGVPLTLLEIKKDTEIAIIEMGANHLKEIEFLCSLADPDIGLITNIGNAHIGEFGGQENIITAKTELYKHILKNKGLLFVNSDSSLLMEKSQGISRSTYGQTSASEIQVNKLDSDTFLAVTWKGIRIETQLIGSYNLGNVTAAIAIGDYFKVDVSDIQEAIASYLPENNRSQLVDKGGHRIIMDAYNANPSSMEAAWETFIGMKSGRHFYILGDMKELGEESLSFHREIIDKALRAKLDGIFIGKDFCEAGQGTNAISFTDTDAAREYLSKRDFTGSLILLKGSRGTKLEVLLDVL